MRRWTRLPAEVHAAVAIAPDSVLLETSRFDVRNARSYMFLDPVRTMAASRLDEVPELFRQVETALAEGLHVAGFVGYECGYHFERFAGVIPEAEALPLAWFGAYREPMVFDHARGCFEGEVQPVWPPRRDELPTRFAEKVELERTEEEYCAKIRRIKEYITAGETYQVNFTDRVRVATEVDAAAAFGTLARGQVVAYSALLHVGSHHILSLSPELFFRIERDGERRRIVTRPMKGTMPRGLDAEEDAAAAARLGSDEKNCAEHVMIVDLLRNDLGRVCEMGSVRVEEIFSVERYETLLQMTSTVAGRLRQGVSYYEIFKSMFPSGSITGAPKIRTMEIIRELEGRPRGVYTGAIGWMAPNGTAAFNVAIRTLTMKQGEASMGVGGGIVADSEPAEEYRECLLKAEFLARPRYDFRLIETMLWEGEFFLLEMHLDRLEASAAYFGFYCDRGEMAARLAEEAGAFGRDERYRVRVLLGSEGALEIACSACVEEQPSGRVRLSGERTSSGDVFLRHKTTRRELYEREYKKARAEGFDDAVFMNERGELTEGAISNIFLRAGGRLLTPPAGCGLLPGVFRRHLIESGACEERILTVDDIEAADGFFLGNSVRGLREVKF